MADRFWRRASSRHAQPLFGHLRRCYQTFKRCYLAIRAPADRKGGRHLKAHTSPRWLQSGETGLVRRGSCFLNASFGKGDEALQLPGSQPVHPCHQDDLDLWLGDPQPSQSIHHLASKSLAVHLALADHSDLGAMGRLADLVFDHVPIARKGNLEDIRMNVAPARIVGGIVQSPPDVLDATMM